jgi:hypothetical protein
VNYAVATVMMGVLSNMAINVPICTGHCNTCNQQVPLGFVCCVMSTFRAHFCVHNSTAASPACSYHSQTCTTICCMIVNGVRLVIALHNLIGMNEDAREAVAELYTQKCGMNLDIRQQDTAQCDL